MKSESLHNFFRYKHWSASTAVVVSCFWRKNAIMTFVFVYLYLCIFICVFVFVYLYVCICICVFVFVYLYLCICICVFVYRGLASINPKFISQVCLSFWLYDWSLFVWQSETNKSLDFPISFICGPNVLLIFSALEKGRYLWSFFSSWRPQKAHWWLHLTGPTCVGPCRQGWFGGLWQHLSKQSILLESLLCRWCQKPAHMHFSACAGGGRGEQQEIYTNFTF